MQPNDHDLLIRLDQKIENMTDEIILLRDGSNKRLAVVEENKLDKKTFDDYRSSNDGNIKALFKSDENIKRILYIGMGIVITLQFIALLVKG